MGDDENQKLINLPYFDFVEAENYGFDIDSFKSDGFKLFVTTTILRDFIRMRKNFISRDIIDSLMKSELIHDITVDVLKKIDSGDIDIADIYIDFVVKMHVFLEKLTEFSYVVENPISDGMIHEFTKLNAICNEFEDRHVKSKIMEQLYKLKFFKYEEENINFESYSDDRKACCNAAIDCKIM